MLGHKLLMCSLSCGQYKMWEQMWMPSELIFMLESERSSTGEKRPQLAFSTNCPFSSLTNCFYKSQEPKMLRTDEENDVSGKNIRRWPKYVMFRFKLNKIE